MANWRERATKFLKGELVSATAAKDIRDISNALSSVQPYEPVGGSESVQPVRIVSSKKRKARRSKVSRSK